MKVRPIVENSSVGTVSCFSNCLGQKKYAITFTNCEILHICDYENEIILKLEHSGNLRTCSFSLDGTLVASGSEDCSIKIWSIENNKVAMQLISQENIKRFKIRSLAFSDDNKMIAASMYDPNIHIFSVESGAIIFKIGNFESPKIDLTGSPCIISGESYLIVGGDDGNNKGYVWKWENLSEQNSSLILIGHSRGIRSIAIKNGKTITGSYDASVRIWDKNGRSLNVMLDHSKPIHFILVSHENDIFFTGSADRSIIKWKFISENCCRIITFDNLNDWVRGIFQIDEENICGITADRGSSVICINLSKYSAKLFKLFYIFELLYIPITAYNLLMLYNLYLEKRYGLAILYTIAFLLPNTAYFFVHYTKYYKNSKEFIIQSIRIFMWAKVPWELLNNWRYPTFIDRNRVNMKSLRYLKIVDTIFNNIPTLIITLYYLLISSSIKNIKIVQIILSSISIIKSLSWSFDDLNYNVCNKILLILYRTCELGCRIGLLALFCTVVYPAYIFVVLFFSSILHYCLFTPPEPNRNVHWTENILRHAQIISNSFAFTFCEELDVKKDPVSGQLVSKFEDLILFRKVKISSFLIYPRNIVCPNATITHIFLQDFINIIINLGLAIIISVMNTKLKYCSIGLMIISIIKWIIPFIIRKRLINRDKIEIENLE